MNSGGSAYYYLYDSPGSVANVTSATGTTFGGANHLVALRVDRLRLRDRCALREVEKQCPRMVAHQERLGLAYFDLSDRIGPRPASVRSR